MASIQIVGFVDQSGCLKIDQEIGLPQGQVLITVEEVTEEMLAADDALWDKKFAETPEILDKIFEEAENEIAAGKVRDFDPDVDEP
jgi:hypothetical protein